MLLTLLTSLSGCAALGPLPVTPLQVLQGAFPTKVDGPAAASQRAYTIKGNTFEYPSLGLAVSRPNADDWAFQPGPNSVYVFVKNNLTGVEPRPSLLVQVGAAKAGVDLKAALDDERTKKVAAGTAVNVVQLVVDGVNSEAWIYDEKDANTGVAVTTLRVNVIQLPYLIFLQGAAAKESYPTVEKFYTQIIASVKLPKAAPVPAEGQAAAEGQAGGGGLLPLWVNGVLN